MRIQFKGILILLLIIMFLPLSLDAQSRRKKKKKRRPDNTEQVQSNFFLEKMWYGLNIGNPGIGGNFFTIGLGPMASYKFTNNLSAGLISDINYSYYWNRFGDNENYIDYSVGVFGRAKFFQSIFAHLEYNYTSLDRATTIEPRSNFPVMFIGGGYSSGRPPWKFEATLLFDVLGNLQTYRIPIVYRIGVTYNF